MTDVGKIIFIDTLGSYSFNPYARVARCDRGTDSIQRRCSCDTNAVYNLTKTVPMEGG